MDESCLIVFAHAGFGNLPDHEELLFLFPTLPLILVGTIVVASVLRERGLLGPDHRTVSLNTTLAAVSAALSMGAAAIHFGSAQQHVAEYLPFGVMFIALGFFQALWAYAFVTRPTRGTAILGAVVNLGASAVWLLSRTTGLPVGPEPWQPEAIGTLDLWATAFEVILVALLLPAVFPQHWPKLSSERMAFERAFVLTAFSLLTVMLLATVAFIQAPAVEVPPPP